MTTATNNRRRNAYVANCCVCMAEVPANAGWLYSDTRRHRRVSGGFPKKVKCDRCHSANIANRWQADNLDNPQPPAPRSWTAPQVRKWDLEIETEQTTQLVWPDPKASCVQVPFVLVHVHVTFDGERIRLAGGDPISNHQTGPYYTLEWANFGGKPLSSGAWAVLCERVDEAIAACHA